MPKYFENTEVNRPQYLGGGKWKLKDLNEITVFFGKNGSGKSILLRQWRNEQIDKLHYIVPERIGQISFHPDLLAEQITAVRRQERSNKNFSENYRQQVITRIQGYFLSRGASRSNVLTGSNPADLEEILSTLISDFTITLKGENPPYDLKRLSNNEPITSVENLSSGESQLITVALDILTIAAIWDLENKETRLILIDEPDAHIHPDLQTRLADFICAIIDKFKVQFVIATHSTTLLSALGQFGKEKTSIAYVSKTSDTLQAQKFNKYLKEVSSCLGGHLLMGPLFGSPLLLVEGDDDYRIWSQVPRHGVINLAVIPSNGDEIMEYQRNLEKILSSICAKNTMGYALLDGDKSLPQSNAQNPQDYIKFIQLNCHESENLFVTDEILADLGTNWKQAKELITAESSNFGNKKDQLIYFTKEDRQKADIKSIINELNKILDKKNVHWTTRVGNRIGKQKPIGQLGYFIGQSVINSLWT